MKSVLCSTIIEQIKTMCKSGIASLAMFFYDFREDQKKDLRGLLSSVLFQLCDQSDSYYNILSAFYSAHREGAQSPTDNKLVQCFKGLLKVQGQAPVYLIIDALDECSSASALSSPRDEVLKLLEDLIDSQLPNLRICVTSRPEVDIKSVLVPLSFRCISLHDERGQQEDIENYIKSVVNTNKRMRRWTPEHKQLVIQELTERADGMFRWAYCQLDYLSKCLPGRIRHALDELPETLDATYERTLQEINDTNWELTRRLLLCVAVVFRPLRVEELAEFLAFEFKDGSIPTYHEDWRLADPIEAVMSTCSTLLALVNVKDSQHNTLSHHYHISTTLAHTLVAQACLGILLHLDKTITSDDLDKFPLAQYAGEHWFEHARFEGVSKHATEEIKELFDEGKPHFAAWLRIWDPTMHFWERNPLIGRPCTLRGTPLHYADFCGLPSIMKVLVTDKLQDVNSRSFRDESTPLHLASQEGHLELTRFLIEHGADVTARAGDGQTPLHRASGRGHTELARFLVELGADTRAHTNFGSTPLHEVSMGGHMELARFLVEQGADVTAQNKDGWTPLYQASLGGHMELARFLVEQGADSTAPDKYGCTPLHRASKGGHMELARFLVEQGADATAQDRDGTTPLHQASEKGHTELVRFLIGQGADATVQDEHGLTPLHGASEGGHIKLAQFLVEQGADAKARDKDGWTPLHEASPWGHMELARFLIEQGADATAQDEDGWTPLHRASDGGHMELVRFLVEQGADATTQAKDGSTPLHGASYKGHVELARFLVEQGADATAQAKDGGTPLHEASKCGHMELARFLVERGADATAQDEQGSTPLHLTSFGDHMTLAQFLVQHGADAASQDDDRRTPLLVAVERGHIQLACFLAQNKIDTVTQATPPIQQLTTI